MIQGLMTVFITACLAPVSADPSAGLTIAYLQKLQTKAGGFVPQLPSAEVRVAPTLRSTTSAARALHYLKGALPDKDACIKLIAACHDARSGGFADSPGGKPDVACTAIGLMAVKELEMPLDKYVAGAVKFLTERARSFEEIRIAAAGLESVQAKSPKNQAWLEQILKQQNPDGTFGKNGDLARDTASAVVTILRLGGTPKDSALVLKTLREGQRLSGGFGKGESETASDLESTYRVMRCFMMLKAQPERVEGLRTFIAKCRNEDGGYGVGPGQPSTVSGTYYAAIMLHWQER